jgi:hypothetical protein
MCVSLIFALITVYKYKYLFDFYTIIYIYVWSENKKAKWVKKCSDYTEHMLGDV